MSGYCNSGGGGSPNVAPNITGISPSSIPVGNTTTITISGAGLTGTTAISATGVTFSITTITATEIVAQATVPGSDPGGTVNLTVTANSQKSNPKSITKQLPSKIAYLSLPGAPNGIGPLQTPVNQNVVNLGGEVLLTSQCGVYRNYAFSLLDQNGIGIIATYTLTESFKNYSGPAGTSVPGTQSTPETPNTAISDIQYMGKTYPSCISTGAQEAFDQQFSVTIGGTQINLSTVIHIVKGYIGGTLGVNETITTP